MYEHNALGYWSGLALCLTKVRSSRARCPATALIIIIIIQGWSGGNKAPRPLGPRRNRWAASAAR